MLPFWGGVWLNSSLVMLNFVACGFIAVLSFTKRVVMAPHHLNVLDALKSVLAFERVGPLLERQLCGCV